MKKYLHIFTVITLINIIFAIYPAKVHASIACSATSTTEFQDCLNQTKTGAVDTILVTRNIVCSSAAGCNFVISDLSNKLTIQGTGASSGFTRNNIANRAVLTFARDSNITLNNLYFSDVGQTCSTSVDDTTCVPVISLSNVKTALFDNIFMNNIARIGIKIAGNQLTTPPIYVIQNSHFTNIGLHSFVTLLDHTTPQGGNFKILNNTFDTIKSNAFALNINSLPNNPSIISGNSIRHAHTTPMYGPTIPGGQLYIYSPVGWDPASSSQNIVIEKNLIYDGFSSAISVWGIEILRVNSKNITIRNNIIMDNNTAMIMDADQKPGSFLSTNIVATNNYFVNNTKLYDNYGNPNPIQTSGDNTGLTRNAALTLFDQIRPPSLSPTPTPSPSPTTTPTLAAVSGDVTDVGDVPDDQVNIFDYNLVLSNFGNPYTIFDYNNVIQNFAK